MRRGLRKHADVGCPPLVFRSCRSRTSESTSWNETPADRRVNRGYGAGDSRSVSELYDICTSYHFLVRTREREMSEIRAGTEDEAKRDIFLLSKILKGANRVI